MRRALPGDIVVLDGWAFLYPDPREGHRQMIADVGGPSVLDVGDLVAVVARRPGQWTTAFDTADLVLSSARHQVGFVFVSRLGHHAAGELAS